MFIWRRGRHNTILIVGTSAKVQVFESSVRSTPAAALLAIDRVVVVNIEILVVGHWSINKFLRPFTLIHMVKQFVLRD